MCGIAGLVGALADRSRVERMTARLRHRGPDDGDAWDAPGVALGHRRLSILDLSAAGRQPMHFGDFTIVYNGEIYNFEDLRRDLAGPFRSRSDTEVLLQLYARDGARCLPRLRGMFAFAVWDARTRTLFAARDRLGQKPFYYAAGPDGLAFASELKALREVHPAALDRAALADFLTYKYVPAPRSIDAGVLKLPPAHALTWVDGRVTVERYWTPSAETVRRDPVAAAGELRGLLADAVCSHLVSDVPLGVFLSGGVDSSALVAHMERPRTFSVGFDIEEHSELPYARLAAERFQTEHHEERVALGGIEEALDAIPAIYDEPFGDSSGWATHVVARVARKHVTVALSGEGGDEAFSGYGWYGKWLETSPSALAGLAGLLPAFSAAGRSCQRRVADGVSRYGALVGLFTPAQQRELLAPDLVTANEDPYWFFRRHWREDLDPVKRMQWLDLHTWLPDDLLVKADRASMATSLEVRPPLLDDRLVEFALTLDAPLLRRGGEGKVVWKKALEGTIPPEILARPKKGFSMPVRRWIQEQPGLLASALRRLAEAGILRSPRPRRFGGEQVWSLLVLDRWLRQ
jgi:asparagine synthase (glutamine-hydrolysing)